jgi:hypothetical protein
LQLVHLRGHFKLTRDVYKRTKVTLRSRLGMFDEV